MSLLPDLDDAAFRRALGSFASGVTVVTTRDGDLDHAMTVSAFTSVSLAPQRVLVCIDHASRFHPALQASGVWGVSILRESGQHASTALARRGRDLTGQLDGLAHHRGVTGVALLDDALAWLEVRTCSSYVEGDHTIVVGDVLAATVHPDADDPLLYYRSHYGTIVRSDASEKDGGADERRD